MERKTHFLFGVLRVRRSYGFLLSVVFKTSCINIWKVSILCADNEGFCFDVTILLQLILTQCDIIWHLHTFSIFGIDAKTHI